jgi:hypothetical protein
MTNVVFELVPVVITWPIEGYRETTNVGRLDRPWVFLGIWTSGDLSLGSPLSGILMPTSHRYHYARRDVARLARIGGYMAGLVWTVIVVLFVLWVAGFALHVGGGLIHLLLVIAVVLIIFNIVTGRGARV